MAKSKRPLTEQLNDAVDAILGGPDSVHPVADPGLMPLVRIAVSLRNLPREEFRARLKSELKRRSVMNTKQVDPIPEKHRGAIPYLVVKDAAKSIEFYKRVFGAKEVMRLVQPDGRVGHAELKIGGVPIMLADEFPEYGILGPESLGGSPVTLHLYVEEVDVIADRAVAAGSRLIRPVSDEFYGDRVGKIADPFGHIWMIATHVEDVSAEEMQNRLDAWASQEASTAAPVQAVREGFHTVTPYIIVQQAAELLDFVKQAFGAEERFRTIGSAGGMHAEVKIGDSMVMIGGGGAWKGESMPCEIHYYVPDADSVYRAAIEAGGTSLYAPMDQPYGDREAGIKDISGNHWYIATHQGRHFLPEGFRTITPTFHMKGAARMIRFLQEAFDTHEVYRSTAPDGTVAHALLRIGDSQIELGEAHGQWQPMPSSTYLYVHDVDALYRRALQAGATSLSEPADQPYGDRNAGVTDPFGNVWYIATHKGKPAGTGSNG